MLYREIPWYWARFTVPEITQLTVRSPFLDNDLVDLLYQAPQRGFNGSDFELRVIEKRNPKLLRIRTNRGIAGKPLPIVSKAVEMLYKTRGVADKVLSWDILPYSLHHAVARIDASILSPLHLNKAFLGFEYYRHYCTWFRHELSSYIQDVLLDRRTLQRPYWNSRHLTGIVNDHIKGRGRYLAEIRKTLSLELIHRTLLENG